MKLGRAPATQRILIRIFLKSYVRLHVSTTHRDVPRSPDPQRERRYGTSHPAGRLGVNVCIKNVTTSSLWNETARRLALGSNDGAPRLFTHNSTASFGWRRPAFGA